MKFAYMFSALAVAATLTACANHHSTSSSTQAAAPDPYGIATLSVAQQQPSVTGTINIRQRIALPPDAVLTVTLSDASLADAPARVLSQKRCVPKANRRHLTLPCLTIRQTFSRTPVFC